MASTNSFDSNFSRPLMEAMLKSFESERVLSKNVNTQLFAGKFNGGTGTQIDVKRPTDFASVESATGDVTGQEEDIITGKATATVQDYITVLVDYDEVDEALKMGNVEELIKPAATRIKTKLETNMAKFMMKNSALLAGVVTTGVTTWKDVAQASAVMKASGVPEDGQWCYALNPFAQVELADQQRGINNDALAKSANERAVIDPNFAGLRVMTANTLASLTTAAGADRVGAVASNPDVTYLTAKDTMTQVIAVNTFQANLVIKAGEVVQITGRNRLNLATREPMADSAGAVVFTGTVVADVTLSGTGTGNIVITGPAIFEAGGAYNTVSSAVVATDVITLLGTASTLRQPNLFWHRDAFTIASVPIKKLSAQDTIGTTVDGLQMRVSRGSDIITNKQIVRFDLHPAFGVMNPFFAGQGYGI